MSITPLFSSVCDLGQRMPEMVSTFLDLEGQIGRRFREDSVSDIIIASLLKIGGAETKVITPYEPVTGSDFDIVIIDPMTMDSIQYRIQAKRLFPHPKQWDIGSYKELAHPHGTGKQASTLVRSSAHEKVLTIPLYAFYNPQSACDASGGAISGIELASGVAVNSIVKHILKIKPRWGPYKRVGFLKSLFFPLSTILCPPIGAKSGGQRLIVSPSNSREAVQREISKRIPPTFFAEIDATPMVHKLSGTPPQAESERQFSVEEPRRGRRTLPAPIRRALEQPDNSKPIRANVRRPKVLLVSRDG